MQFPKKQILLEAEKFTVQKTTLLSSFIHPHSSSSLHSLSLAVHYTHSLHQPSANMQVYYLV